MATSLIRAGALTPYTMTSSDDWLSPRIYVACLASYNEGTLYGEWIDAVQDADDLRREVILMLGCSPILNAEEWAIHDHEGFAPLSIHEHECLDDVSAAALLINEHREAAALMLAYLGGAEYHEEAQKALEDRYAGEWDTVEAWVDELLDEGLYGPIPDRLRYFIDVNKIAGELQMGGDINVLPGESSVHIFWA